MKINRNCFKVLLVLSFCLIIATAFNLSPKPNAIIRQPSTTIVKQTESAYFGFSIIMRDKNIYIGAPRAQSTLESQKNVSEPGAIYKCSYHGQCFPFVFDALGNTNAVPNDYTFDSERKDNQWLGAAMDGGPNEKDRLIVCAPRLIAPTNDNYLLHGICYWTPNTLGPQPTSIRKISPLRLKNDQTHYINKKEYLYYAYGEVGFSVHNTEDNEEFLIGAPGVANWKGTVIRYHAKPEEDLGGHSRRDLSSIHHKSKRAALEYTSEVLQPELWGQQDDSYFGYAISSAKFEGPNSTHLYIATAPQSDQRNGETFIFEIVQTRYALSIKKKYAFKGSQFGEHFGYTIITEDINGDGLVDVIVSAPLYYSGSTYDNGAIYVYLNTGQLTFGPGTKITTGKDIRARFGTTLTKLGDINRDGYNDIAVGAPFEGKGVVYVYLGGPNGLQDKPSQVIQAQGYSNISSQDMFGHGISRGVDIDLNGFNDLAIGAPNIDTVFIYRSYPVVKIATKVSSPTQEIKIDQTKIQLKACWKLETKSPQIHAQEINFKLIVDPQFQRVTFTRGTNVVIFKAIANTTEECQIYDANIKFSQRDIFKPIEIEMHYDLSKKIPDTEEFCTTCAVVDPADPKVFVHKIAFNTGCKSEICVSDLKIKSSGVVSPFILGSSNSISVKYIITNDGETAYLPQINITSSNRMPFVRIPSSCTLGNYVLLCSLFKGRPLAKGNYDTLTISFDTTNIQGKHMLLRATTFSSGKELMPLDNVVDNVILLEEFSNVDITSRAVTPTLSLEDGLGIVGITNTLEIRNNGPSAIKQMDVSLYIPLSYLIPNTQIQVPLINFNNMTVTAKFNNINLDITYKQNGTILIQNPIETSSTKKRSGTTTAATPKSEAPRKLANQISGSEANIKSLQASDFQKIAQRQAATEIIKALSGSVPVNRTVFFNCYEQDEAVCVQATMTVSNLLRGDNFVDIKFKYSLDLDVVNKILIESKDFFVVTTLIKAHRNGDIKGNTIEMTGASPHNIISKHHLYSTPIWIIIVSAIGGLLILLAITFGMYKLGFFHRTAKDQLEEAKLNPASDTDDEN